MLERSLAGVKDVLHLINHGSREVLLDLPGFGPRRVDKILSLRQTCLEEGRKLRIKDVVSGKNGVGQALLAKLAGEGNAATVIKYSAFYQQYFYRNDHEQFQVDRCSSYQTAIAEVLLKFVSYSDVLELLQVQKMSNVPVCFSVTINKTLKLSPNIGLPIPYAAVL